MAFGRGRLRLPSSSPPNSATSQFDDDKWTKPLAASQRAFRRNLGIGGAVLLLLCLYTFGTRVDWQADEGLDGRDVSNSAQAAREQDILRSWRQLHGARQGTGDLALTTIGAHAAGFTVFENLYWRNHTFHIVTDQPYAFPPLDEVATYAANSAWVPLGPDGPIRLWGIRNERHSRETDEARLRGATLTYREAAELFGQAEVIEGGPMLLNNDDTFGSHYYHQVGECLHGALKVWYNFWWRFGIASAPPFATIGYLQFYAPEEAPPALRRDIPHPWIGIWEDVFGATKALLQAANPGVSFETRMDWDARAASNKLYRMPLILLADRWAGNRGASSGHKLFGDAFRLPGPPDIFQQVRARVLGGPPPRSAALARQSAAHPTKPKPRKPKPTVMYLSRQGTWRNFTEPTHERLMRELFKLEAEGVATVVVETFERTGVDRILLSREKDAFLPIKEQIRRIADVDVLVGLHGNGLTHVLWMNPGSTVFEVQPAGCSYNDFSPLAQSAGVTHWMVHYDTKCAPLECPSRGCAEGLSINAGVFDVDVDYLVREVRATLAAQLHALPRGAAA